MRRRAQAAIQSSGLRGYSRRQRDFLAERLVGFFPVSQKTSASGGLMNRKMKKPAASARPTISKISAKVKGNGIPLAQRGQLQVSVFAERKDQTGGRYYRSGPET